MNDPAIPDDAYDVICKFNERLLGVSNGRVAFIDTLVKQIRDTSLEAKADSKMTSVVGSRGQALDRHSLLQIERGCMSEASSSLQGKVKHAPISEQYTQEKGFWTNV